jgi:hypothetical protein
MPASFHVALLANYLTGNAMQIFKTIVTNGTTILPIDTISYGDGLRLVPHWIATGDGLGLMPDRIIRIDVLSLRKLEPPQPWEYHLLDCVPNSVLDGPLAVSDASQFVVIDRPKHIIRNLCIESSHG